MIVAGRPSMGKTTLAINMAENVALDPNVKGSVLIFSMEMPSEQLMTRMLSSVGGVPLHDIRSGRISDQDWVRITSATSQLAEARIFIDESPGLTPTELRARARRVKREHGLDMVVVDYLQLMQVHGTKENRATEISEISRGLKALAKELNVPVIALSQLNRSVEQRESKKPVMSDLRECVTGETLVCLTDGRRVPIRDLVGHDAGSLGGQRTAENCRGALRQGVVRGAQPVFRVQLASGRSIRATAEHRLLAGEGWKTVAQLATGDRLAFPGACPNPYRRSSWPDHHLVLLGIWWAMAAIWFISLCATPRHRRKTAGSARGRGGIRLTVTRHAGRGAWHQLVISGNGNRWHAKGVGAWLKELGIFGQRSHEKHLPARYSRSPTHRWRCCCAICGPPTAPLRCASPGSGAAPRVYFATCSPRLAGMSPHCCLRLGIVARIRTVHAAAVAPMYTVDVSGAEATEAIRGDGGRIRAACGGRCAHLPANRNDRRKPECGYPAGGGFCTGTGADAGARKSRRVRWLNAGHILWGHKSLQLCAQPADAFELRQLLEAPELDTWATSDLFWDRITGLCPMEKRKYST